jgi:hypothetical protein
VRIFESSQATIISTFVAVFLLAAQDMATLAADTPPLKEPVMDRPPDMPGLPPLFPGFPLGLLVDNGRHLIPFRMGTLIGWIGKNVVHHIKTPAVSSTSMIALLVQPEGYSHGAQVLFKIQIVDILNHLGFVLVDFPPIFII